MTSPVDGIQAVLARISQIQAQWAQLSPSSARAVPSANTTSSTSTTSAADFAATLNSVGGASATAGTTAAGTSPTGDAIVASAKKYLGVPYVFGGTTPSGLDCSGLVQRAYGDLGISLPRLSWDQARTGTAVPDLAHAQPGDILGFGTPAHHVAIYLGNDMMIAAPQPGENVKIQSVYETPASIRRIVGTDNATSMDPFASGLTGAAATTSGGGAVSASLSSYAASFSQNEMAYKLPPGLLAAVAQTESGGDASAVSPAGARGLMQLMPSTASGLGVDPFNPTQSIRGAAELLSNYLQRYGSVPLALAAYNAGPGAVDQYGGVPPYTETQNYVHKITALMGQT